jgi:protein involved in sex pheromone biosynthesis
MKRTLVIMCLAAVVGLGGCSGATSNYNAANVNSNLNSNTAPANVGVVQNNNGNQNTSGVRPINSNNANSNASPRNQND